MDKDATKKGLHRLLFGDGKISVRFRNYNIALFTLAFFLMVTAMMTAFYSIIKDVSSAYTGRYATSSADALSAHIVKEIALMRKAAGSSAVIDWLSDEDSEEKKIAAYEEMSGVIGGLYSNNLYVGFEKSRHEYKLETEYTADDMRHFDTLDKNNPEDFWYFDCIASDKDYALSIGIDHVLQKKRVWLDYKIIHNGVMLGVICTGLDFPHIAGELFSNYHTVIRGLVVDVNGVINMDSAMLDNEDFLQYDYEANFEDEFTDPVLLAVIKSRLSDTGDYFDKTGEPTVIRLSGGQYRYATIAPIRFTNWLAVILYDSSSSLNMMSFMPVFIAMIVLLIGFSLATNAISRRLIFWPLEQLVRSLGRLREDQDERIYGLDRNDEFGNLSNTIYDLFTKANRDALTGIYNRRFMENNLHRLMEFLSRSNSFLTVLMIDVDYFKKYNDTYGHEQGDVCLKTVARTLAGSTSRSYDFVARYGGEEFVAVLPNTDAAGARILAQNMLDNVRMQNMPHANSTAGQYVTVSIGVTTGTVSYLQTWESYVKRADEALYMSKQNGRDRYTYLNFTGNADTASRD